MSSQATGRALKRMSVSELDSTAQRVEDLETLADELRDKLQEQVEAFGSIPPRAEKSRRLVADLYQFTVSSSSSTEIRDAEVLRIKAVCSDELFRVLFQEVTKFKLGATATRLLAGVLPKDAPTNLRKLFAQAVVMKEGSPRLRVEKIGKEALEPA